MVKHISIHEWRQMKKMATINPEELSRADKETCFVPRWTVGAVDALHEALEDYLVTLLEDANLFVIHAWHVTLQPRDIQLAWRIRGDKDWDVLEYTKWFGGWCHIRGGFNHFIFFKAHFLSVNVFQGEGVVFNKLLYIDGVG